MVMFGENPPVSLSHRREIEDQLRTIAIDGINARLQRKASPKPTWRLTIQQLPNPAVDPICPNQKSRAIVMLRRPHHHAVVVDLDPVNRPNARESRPRAQRLLQTELTQLLTHRHRAHGIAAPQRRRLSALFFHHDGRHHLPHHRRHRIAQRAQRFPCQPSSARLVPRKLHSIQQQDRPPRRREVVRSRASRRTGANDDGVPSLHDSNSMSRKRLCGYLPRALGATGCQFLYAACGGAVDPPGAQRGSMPALRIVSSTRTGSPAVASSVSRVHWQSPAIIRCDCPVSSRPDAIRTLYISTHRARTNSNSIAAASFASKRRDSTQPPQAITAPVKKRTVRAASSPHSAVRLSSHPFCSLPDSAISRTSPASDIRGQV